VASVIWYELVKLMKCINKKNKIYNHDSN